MSDHVTLLTAMVEVEHESRTPGFRTISLTGERWANALVGVVAENYHRFTGRPEPELTDDLIGEKVTVIMGGENMLGSGSIYAREGRIFMGRSGQYAILPKGKRSNGYQVRPEHLIDLLPGWNLDMAQALVSGVRDQYPPDLRNLTQERLAELPGENQGSMCSLALFGWHPLFGTSDCIWLIGEYWPDDDICDQSVVFIREEFGVSEHGSSYGTEHLQSRARAEIVGFEPIPFDEAVRLCERPYDEAAARVFGRVTEAVTA